MGLFLLQLVSKGDLVHNVFSGIFKTSLLHREGGVSATNTQHVLDFLSVQFNVVVSKFGSGEMIHH